MIVKKCIRNALRERYPTAVLPKIKVGHGGTLDMHAEGVLAVGIGKATKFLPYYLKGNKTYKATGILGYETDTLDVHGNRIKEGAWEHVTDSDFDEAVQSMNGTYDQIPPMYSSKKYQGMSLRDYARKKLPVDIKSCRVTIHNISRIKSEKQPLPHFTLVVTSSGGTYVRSLIRDIAYKLNTYGTMETLVRIAKCDLSVSDSLNVESLDYDTIIKNIRHPNIL
ncbi:pseudouridine synthase like protein [Babesia gibsoni]|uniref:tRNA pseudouridine(55) synthase n=1 Tax=Babesia gibsoni TaxID=33632 RepID=A0AAD8PFT9_BABGI|nr:pseudouridine synthase like protein [Babesia gibsoni]